MFTLGAGLAVAFAAWLANRANREDEIGRERRNDDDMRSYIVHARQDLRVIAFLLGIMIIMLGIIADRLS